MVHLLDDTIHVLMAPTNRLAKRPHVTLSDLRDERWAVDTTANDYSGVIVQACGEVGFEPTITGKCHGFEVVRAMIAAGCSISIQPGLRWRNSTDDLIIKELRPTITGRISAAFRRGEGRNSAAKAFVVELGTLAPRMRA